MMVENGHNWPKSAKNPPKIRTIPKAKIQSKSFFINLDFRLGHKQIISYNKAALN